MKYLRNECFFEFRQRRILSLAQDPSCLVYPFLLQPFFFGVALPQLADSRWIRKASGYQTRVTRAVNDTKGMHRHRQMSPQSAARGRKLNSPAG
jgi:hypothetical protein